MKWADRFGEVLCILSIQKERGICNLCPIFYVILNIIPAVIVVGCHCCESGDAKEET
jgi:hypothetical protein